jgi:hypothetical protein
MTQSSGAGFCRLYSEISNFIHGAEIRYQLETVSIIIYRPSDCRLSAKLVPTFADRGCRVVSSADPYGRNLGVLDRNRYYFFQVAHQLYSRG